MSEQTVSEARISEFVHWYPAIKQIEMRDEWLAEFKPGEWQFTGMVTADDRTVITPQADVNYGYSWFNISNAPVVISMPAYDRYYSLSVFDMNHFMEVFVAPEKPVVVRLPHQQSPVADAHEIVLHTYQGLAFARQTIVQNEAEVMALGRQITLTGGGGDFPFTVPVFTEAEASVGLERIKAYALGVTDARRLFGSPYEGVGDLDRAAGVFLGQLGTQARYVDYTQYVHDQDGDRLDGKDRYEVVVPAEGVLRSDKGYWSLTIYSMADRYLIPNPKGIHHVSMYEAQPNADGSYTLRIDPDGEGDNAIPSAGVDFYGVFRFYEPVPDLDFPQIKRVG